jgi:hypothetical protein
MLKLIRIRKWHIPNAVAITAALLLLVSTLISVEQPGDPAPAPLLAASQADTIPHQATEPEQFTLAPAKQARKFRVNLFLFRH